MAPNKIIRAIVLAHGTSSSTVVNDGQISLAMNEIHFPEDELNRRAWRLCPFSAQIGLPLKMVGVKEAARGKHKVSDLLFVEPNPDHKSFGDSWMQCHSEDIVVTRCDGGEFQPSLLNVVLAFSQQFFSSARALAGKTDQKSYAAKKKLAANVNPEAFKAFFDTLGKPEGGMMLIPAQSNLPGAFKGKLCQACGLMEEREEAKEKLLSCGGCKSVYYCNKECQKLVWRYHKEICKRQEK